MFLIIFLFLIITPASPLSFNFTSFEPNNHDIKYEGNAAPLNSAIQLTENQHDITGHASYVEPFHLWDKDTGNLASFVTNFTYSIDIQNNASHSDGIAFFIANLHFRPPDIQQGSGIGLASGNQTLNSTANPFVAVEFDTYHNGWDDVETDHVGVDVSSLRSSKSTNWFSVLDGSIMDASIAYDSSSKTLCAYFTGKAEGFIIPQNLCYEIDLRDHLPEFVLIGFSAATGMYSEFHRIHSWSFDSYFPPSVPPSSSPTPPDSPPKNDENEESSYMIAMIVGWVLFFAAFVSLIYLFLRMKRGGENGARPSGVETVTVANPAMRPNGGETGNGPIGGSSTIEEERSSSSHLEDRIGIGTYGGSGRHQSTEGTGSELHRSRRISLSGRDQDGPEHVTTGDRNRRETEDSSGVNNRENQNHLASLNHDGGETQIGSSSPPSTVELHVVSEGTPDLR